VEAHLFGFAEDLYGQEVAVGLLHFIREEQKFESFEALKAQILRDAATARALLDAGAGQTA
jgi:riboflavin kinase/FMN adenylyltransferase